MLMVAPVSRPLLRGRDLLSRRLALAYISAAGALPADLPPDGRHGTIDASTSRKRAIGHGFIRWAARGAPRGGGSADGVALRTTSGTRRRAASSGTERTRSQPL